MASDHVTTLRVVERWKATAAEEVDTIEGWRDASAGDRQAYRGWMTPKQLDAFYSATTYLVSELTVSYPKLDPSPLVGIQAVVRAWNTQHGADDLPSQVELAGTLDSAMMVLLCVETTFQSYSAPARKQTWAKRFDISEKTLSRRIKSGVIRAVEVSGQFLRVHKDDLPPRAGD